MERLPQETSALPGSSDASLYQPTGIAEGVVKAAFGESCRHHRHPDFDDTDLLRAPSVQRSG
jgi:hypothetical protein